MYDLVRVLSNRNKIISTAFENVIFNLRCALIEANQLYSFDSFRLFHGFSVYLWYDREYSMGKNERMVSIFPVVVSGLSPEFEVTQ